MYNPSFRNCFILVLFILFSGSLFSQPNFKPGYLISNKNDTIVGLIDSRGNVKNSKICRFKKDKDSEITVYKPYEIKAYRLSEEGRFYVSYIIMSNGSTKEIFAEYLMDGIVDLYFYQDTEPHYLLQNSDGDVYELKNGLTKEELREGKTQNIRSNNYVGLLKACFKDQPSLFKDIDIMKLSQSSLVDISVRYHDLSCTEGKCIVYSKPKPPVSFETSVFFGPDFRIASFGGTGRPLTLSEYKYRNGYRIGILSVVTAPKLTDRFFLQLGYTYFKSDLSAGNLTPNKVSKVVSEMALKGSTIGINSVYRYPRGKFRPFVSAGISFNSIKVVNDFNYLLLDYDVVEDWSYSQNYKSAFGFGGSLGCTYMGFKNLYLNLSVNYDYTSASYLVIIAWNKWSSGQFYFKGFSTLLSVGHRF
jgi:hypothetical protein